MLYKAPGTTWTYYLAELRVLRESGRAQGLFTASRRRSGTIEAVAGEAEPMTTAAKMANSIEHANHLHNAYAPVEFAAVRTAGAARLRGRRRIRETED